MSFDTYPSSIYSDSDPRRFYELGQLYHVGLYGDNTVPTAIPDFLASPYVSMRIQQGTTTAEQAISFAQTVPPEVVAASAGNEVVSRTVELGPDQV